MRLSFTTDSVTSNTLRAINHDPIVDALRAPDQRRHAPPLREWFTSVGAAYAAVLARVDCAPDDGVELLSQVDAFAIEPEGRWVRGDQIRVLEELRIRRDDILVAGAGQIGETTLFGRPVLADSRLVGRIAAADILILRGCEDRERLLYAYAVLCSSYGIRAIRSCAYGTSIPRIRTDLVAMIPLPHAEVATVRRVAKLIAEATKRRERLAHSMAQARGIVDAHADVRTATDMCRDRRARCVEWDGPLRSLCAWNTASTGGALAFLRSRWRGRLADLLAENGLFYGLLRQRTPCSPGEGVPLITQRDAQSVRQLPSWIADPGVDRRALFSPPNSIVIPGRGTLGEGEVFGVPILVTPRLAQFALTQDLLRLVPQFDWLALVHLFLSTLLGRRLIRSCAVGTKILQLRLDLLRDLPVPDLDSHALDQLRALHASVVGHFDAATEAEEEAVRIIEEEVLLQWLA